MEDGPEELCDRIRGRLVGALTLATGDRAVAEELAQEALVRAWQRWDHVSRLDSPEAWTFRVAFNLAGSWRRRKGAERRAHRRAGPPPEHHDDPDGAAVTAVRTAVAGLPERQRAVVIARYYLGYDVAGTAALLGCAPGTVKAATSHALANLRRAELGDPIPRSHDVEEAQP